MKRTVTVNLGTREVSLVAKVERDGAGEEWYIAYNNDITVFGCGCTPDTALEEFIDYVRSYYRELKKHEDRLAPRLQRHLEILEAA